MITWLAIGLNNYHLQEEKQSAYVVKKSFSADKSCKFSVLNLNFYSDLVLCRLRILFLLVLFLYVGEKCISNI